MRNAALKRINGETGFARPIAHFQRLAALSTRRHDISWYEWCGDDSYEAEEIGKHPQGSYSKPANDWRFKFDIVDMSHLGQNHK